jgi:Protein of unknown function (DUF2950)
MIKRPSFPRPCSFPSLRWLTCLAVATAFLTIANGAVAQQRYNTPDEAVAALIRATRTGAPALLMRVLGPGSDEIVSSGDPVADAFTRKRLLDAYNIRHQIVREGEDHAVLVIGQEEWPLPIPLMRFNNTWRFDAQAARREIVFRRIGKPVSFTLKPSGNTPRRVSQVRESTHSGSSANREKKMASIGRRYPARTRARSVSSPPLRRRRDIPSTVSADLIMVTIFGFSPGKGRMPLAAKSTTWCAAT